ncbi:hypothetical protein [Domibacillus epiphyticus]|uniref:S-layer protein n=1 Tax=Domibacillus epiphyticus TaxID=1714355 RepID=A0A1V2A6I2_9BACI|nr:hypothetical protein [Domibacillus epiphyticus]OMP66615.1 hypothetical protein BTO28_11245 [Domibacillus epiphyticus]
MKKMFILMVLILAGCGMNEEAEPVSESHEIKIGDRSLVLESETLHAKKESNPEGLDAMYQDTDYHYKTGGNAKVTVKVRDIKNGDQFVMLQLKGKGTLTGTLEIPSANDYYFVDWTKNIPKREHDDVIGADKTKPPAGLFRYTNDHEFVNEVVMSHTFTSRERNKLYGSGRESMLRELVSEKNTLRHSKKGIEFTMTAERDEITEQWFLLAREPLFHDTDHLNEWITFQQTNYKEVNNWFTVDGSLKKLPWSIEPFTKDGYGRLLGIMMEKEALDRYFKYKDRYFYNLTVQTAANLWAYREAKSDTVWKTEYTSNWLKQKYDITAPYVDTRYNELIVLNLNRLGREFGVSQLEATLPEYSDYLLNLISIENVIHADKGYLPADYYSPQQGRQYIHASLNHALGEANMFIDVYNQTKEKKYLHAATDIRAGIESIGTDWIRPNGDLWYQINRDGTFDGNDYERLTLNDLKAHEKKWKSIGGKPSPILQKLIESKEQYLKSK